MRGQICLAAPAKLARPEGECEGGIDPLFSLCVGGGL